MTNNANEKPEHSFSRLDSNAKNVGSTASLTDLLKDDMKNIRLLESTPSQNKVDDNREYIAGLRKNSKLINKEDSK